MCYAEITSNKRHQFNLPNPVPMREIQIQHPEVNSHTGVCKSAFFVFVISCEDRWHAWEFCRFQTAFRGSIYTSTISFLHIPSSIAAPIKRSSCPAGGISHAGEPYVSLPPPPTPLLPDPSFSTCAGPHGAARFPNRGVHRWVSRLPQPPPLIYPLFG